MNPEATPLRLADIAHARSGDKADRADIGVFAWDEAGYRVLAEVLTPERVAAHFAHLTGTASPEAVRRYELPQLLALKFVIEGALSGGAAHSLRSDNLGKTLAAQLLRMPLALPAESARELLEGTRAAIERF
jgi:hypothetical protein